MSREGGEEEGWEGRERRELEGRGRGREGAEGEEMVGKWKGGIDLDICPAAPEFLVTPQASTEYSGVLGPFRLHRRDRQMHTKYVRRV